MDGVLVDTEHIILQAAMTYFREQGIETSPEDFTPHVGAGENRYIGEVARKHGIAVDIADAKLRVYEWYDRLCRGNLPPMDGVVEFITWCRAKNLRLAIATSADEAKLLINLREIDLSPELFDCIVSGSDAEHQKPHPEIYQKAASGMQLHPSECVVIEDALNGIQAGKAAGAYCVGVSSTFSSDELFQAGADRTAESLLELIDDSLLTEEARNEAQQAL